MIKLDQKVKIFIPQGNLKTKTNFEIRGRSRFPCALHSCCSIAQFAFLLTKKMNKSKVKPRKIKFEREPILDFS